MNIKSEMLEKLKKQKIFDGSQEIELKKKLASDWFISLRNEICETFETIENSSSNDKKISFQRKEWEREGGGGGTISIMKGNVFEKVGVNISTVHGVFSKQFREQIPGAEKNGKFWASGISVVSHMLNPHVPAAHMNTRFLITGDGKNKKIWFGGGGDLTPIFDDKDAKDLFHQKFKDCCDKYDLSYYPDFKKWCDEYFYLPHRNEARGIGGIFFDYETKDWIKNFKFVRELGLAFIDISNKVINRKKNFKYQKKDKEKQLFKRGRYVEFNLLYDRGTKFGLNSGGNVDSILMSLPPEAKWK